MTGNGPETRLSAPQQTWEFLFHQITLFAHYQINRLRWRGAYDGVLPEGYDANSLAAQAIFEFLLAHNPKFDPNLNPDCLQAILYELQGTIVRHVTRLHHLKENWILSGAEDLHVVQIDDSEFYNPIELIPDEPAHHPDSTVLENEALTAFESTKSRFSSFLKPERRLRNYFHLLCDSTEKPQAIAGKIKLRRAAVKNLSKQLRRRWHKCFRDH
jgi:hypothetical protein